MTPRTNINGAVMEVGVGCIFLDSTGLSDDDNGAVVTIIAEEPSYAALYGAMWQVRLPNGRVLPVFEGELFPVLGEEPTP